MTGLGTKRPLVDGLNKRIVMNADVPVDSFVSSSIAVRLNKADLILSFVTRPLILWQSLSRDTRFSSDLGGYCQPSVNRIAGQCLSNASQNNVSV